MAIVQGRAHSLRRRSFVQQRVCVHVEQKLVTAHIQDRYLQGGVDQEETNLKKSIITAKNARFIDFAENNLHFYRK